jgi:hypothetical protein
MVTLTQNTNNYYPWWHSPKTPTTITHGGTHEFPVAAMFVNESGRNEQSS